MISFIAHPTDFSDEGMVAFEHALRLALLNRCRLVLLHVRASSDSADWRSFPHVRETLQRWQFLGPDVEPDEVLAQTGVKVSKVDIHHDDAAGGLATYLEDHHPDLIVMASHGRAGIERSLKGSVSSGVVRRTLVPTLILGPAVRPFVASDTGALNIKTIVVPVDHDPSPNGVVRELEIITTGLEATLDFVHVGERAPSVRDGQGVRLPVRRIDGPVVDALLKEATRADLLVMRTAGRNGFLDAIRGSTTERMVGGAGCPLLVLPIQS
jgi:nucleotide-binding universal stress UspA family protein